MAILGTGVISFQGSSDYLKIPYHSMFELGANYTIDFRLNLVNLTSDAELFAFAASPGHGIIVRWNESSSGKIKVYHGVSGTFTSFESSANPFASSGTWYHVAIVNNAGSQTIYVDGVSVGTGSLSDPTYTIKNDLYIGCEYLPDTDDFNLYGSLDEYRVSNVARWTTGFTPPAAAYTTDANTVLLLHGDGADGSTFIEDSAQNSSAIQPVFGTGFGVFQNGYSNLRFPDHSDWTFGTNDFTIEFRMMALKTPTGNDRIVATTIWPNNGGFLICLYTDLKLRFYDSNTDALEIESDNAISLHTWYHVAISRSSGTLKMFVDGVEQTQTHGSSNYSNNYLAVGDNLTVGAEGFEGLLDEFRVSNNARFTTGFTPSASEYTNDANTLALLHMNGSTGDTTFTDSSTTGHAVTTNGTAVILQEGNPVYAFGDVAINNFQPKSIVTQNALQVDINTPTNILRTTQNALQVDINTPTNTLRTTQYALQVDIQTHETSAVTLPGSDPGDTSVYFNGTFYVDDILTIVEAGFCYSKTETTPTIADSKETVTVIEGVNNISQYVTTLTRGITHYVRAYITTSTETVYGDVIETSTLCPKGIDTWVTMLCHFNGTDGSTTLVDDVGGKTLTANGGAQLDTDQKKFGDSALYLPSASSSYVSIPDDADFDLGAEDFEFDMQVRFASLPTSGNRMCLFSSWEDTLKKGYRLCIYNNSGTYELELAYSTDGSNITRRGTEISIAIDTWYHIVFCRDSNNLALFLNGGNIGGYYIGTDEIYNSSEDFKLGARNTTETDFLNGHIDDFRFSKGTARYTISTFIPPTTNLTPDGTYDKMLLHMDGSDASTIITDSAFEIDPLFGTGMGKFDGVGDYLSIPDHSDFDFGSNDFTLDCRFFANEVVSKYQVIFAKMNTASSGISFQAGLYYDNAFIQWSTSGGLSGRVFKEFAGSGILPLQWNHLVFVRSGADLKCYLNGVQYGTTHNIGTSTLYNSSEPFKIGVDGNAGNYYYEGYLDEIRVSSNARWTSDFAVPTSEYSSDANTSLLLHCNGVQDSTTFTDDGNTGHTVTANGDAKIKTSDNRTLNVYNDAQIKTSDGGVSPKLGTGMCKLDGTNDGLYTLSTYDLILSNSDFLIETYAYFNSLPTSNPIALLEQKEDPSVKQATRIDILYNATIPEYELRFIYTTDGVTGKDLKCAYPFSTGEWYHIAIARKTDKVYFFINGYLIKTTDISTDTIYESTSYLRIGVYYDGGSLLNDLNGYLDEFRYRVGDSDYTPTSFTPPTAEYSICTGSRLKFWNGSSWEAKTIKYWNGSAWEEKPLKFWNGSSWEV